MEHNKDWPSALEKTEDRQPDVLGQECQQMMGLLVKMSGELLSHAELAEFSRHLASCPTCADTFSKLHDLESEAILMKGEDKLFEMLSGQVMMN